MKKNILILFLIFICSWAHAGSNSDSWTPECRENLKVCIEELDFIQKEHEREVNAPLCSYEISYDLNGSKLRPIMHKYTFEDLKETLYLVQLLIGEAQEMCLINIALYSPENRSDAKVFELLGKLKLQSIGINQKLETMTYDDIKGAKFMLKLFSADGTKKEEYNGRMKMIDNIERLKATMLK